MYLTELLAALRQNRDFMAQVVAWERLPARQGSRGGVPGFSACPDYPSAWPARGHAVLYPSTRRDNGGHEQK